MIVAIGVASDALGLASNRSSWFDRANNVAYERTEHYSTPSSAYRVAKDHVPVDWGHDGKAIGQVAHLELDHGNLWAIAELDVERCSSDVAANLTAAPIFWSPASIDRRSHDSVDAELLALGLTPNPATNALPAVTLLAGNLERATRLATGPLLPRLRRALEARRHRHRGDRIHILEVGAALAPTGPSARGNQVADHEGPVEGNRLLPLLAPRSNSGVYKWINGRHVEIEHTASYAGVLSVR